MVDDLASVVVENVGVAGVVDLENQSVNVKHELLRVLLLRLKILLCHEIEALL